MVMISVIVWLWTAEWDSDGYNEDKGSHDAHNANY